MTHNIKLTSIILISHFLNLKPKNSDDLRFGKNGGAGDRTRGLSHAKRTLYH